jgi:fructose-specific phosphotransferase system component IIB
MNTVAAAEVISSKHKTNKKVIVLVTLMISLALIISGLTFFAGYGVGKNTEEELAGKCEYDGKVYEEGDSFKDSDGCNSCGCNNGEVVCTLMACSDNTGSTVPPIEDESFSKGKIYLVALGSDSGKVIGCGDSLIPVDVEFEPQSGLHKASLEKLFSIKEQTYGQSGLTNQLYQSDLKVISVLRIDNDMKVSLEGNIIETAGACDIPRIIEQIRETARQGDETITVEIFVNNESIEDVLSLRD